MPNVLTYIVVMVVVYAGLHECHVTILPPHDGIYTDENHHPYFFYVPLYHTLHVNQHSSFVVQHDINKEYDHYFGSVNHQPTGTQQSQPEGRGSDSDIIQYTVIQPDGSIRKFPFPAST